MFGGSSEHTLDSNNRLIIPARFRYELGQTFVITKGIGCLRVFTSDQFREITDQAKSLGSTLGALFNPELMRVYRHLFSGMAEATTDSQNRVQLSPELKQHAGIDNQVLLVGMGDWLEIWNPVDWEAYRRNEMTDDKVVDAVGTLMAAAQEKNAGVSQTGPA